MWMMTLFIGFGTTFLKISEDLNAKLTYPLFIILVIIPILFYTIIKNDLEVFS